MLERTEVDDGRIASLDPVSGAVSWSRTTGGQAAVPVTVGDRLVTIAAVADSRYRLLAVDPATGEEVACNTVERVVVQGMAADPLDLLSAFELIVGSPRDRTFLTALDARTGTELWATDPAEQRMDVALGLTDGPDSTLVVASASNVEHESPRYQVRGLDPSTGAERWAADTTLGEGTVLGDGVLFAGDTDVTYLDAVTGTFRWDIPEARAEARVAADRLYEDSDGTALASTNRGPAVLDLDDGHLTTTGEDHHRILRRVSATDEVVAVEAVTDQEITLFFRRG